MYNVDYIQWPNVQREMERNEKLSLIFNYIKKKKEPDVVISILVSLNVKSNVYTHKKKRKGKKKETTRYSRDCSQVSFAPGGPILFSHVDDDVDDLIYTATRSAVKRYVIYERATATLLFAVFTHILRSGAEQDEDEDEDEGWRQWAMK